MHAQLAINHTGCIGIHHSTGRSGHSCSVHPCLTKALLLLTALLLGLPLMRPLLLMLSLVLLQDYEALPVEDFGKALLRGMGWEEGLGLGKKRKHVDAVQYVRRPERLGLGAQPTQEQLNHRKPKKQGASNTQLLCCLLTRQGTGARMRSCCLLVMPTARNAGHGGGSALQKHCRAMGLWEAAAGRLCQLPHVPATHPFEPYSSPTSQLLACLWQLLAVTVTAGRCASPIVLGLGLGRGRFFPGCACGVVWWGQWGVAS